MQVRQIASVASRSRERPEKDSSVPSPSDPVAFTLLGLTVRWYAIIILTGILCAIWLVRVLARQRGLNPDFPLDIAPWVVFSGIVGARIYYILLRGDYFLEHPGEAFNIRLGGLSIHGAVLAGVPVVAYFCYRAGQHFLTWADLTVAGAALGQAIGRWGNWANQEAFGTPTSLLWGVAIDPRNRPRAYASVEQFHPTFLYESLFNLLNVAILVWIVVRIPNSRWLRQGDALGVYLVLYGIARFAIERIRTDSLYIGALPAAYWLSFGFAIAGAIILIWGRLTPKSDVANGPSRP